METTPTVTTTEALAARHGYCAEAIIFAEWEANVQQVVTLPLTHSVMAVVHCCTYLDITITTEA